MAQVPATEQTNDQLQQQNDTQESLQTSVLDKIKGGDVFKTLANDLPSKEVDPKLEEAPQEEEQPQEEQPQEETQEDEEVIPKSKIQPRFDQMRAQIARLEQKLADKEREVPVDDTQRQLDAMSEDDLENTLTQVRVAKEKARDNDEKLMELVKLERRVEKQIMQAPQRFNQNQAKEFNSVVNRLASEGEITDANYSKILETAKGIYDKYPKMQKAVDGQAMALELAVEHYKLAGRTSTVNASTQNLKTQVNTLKKKTALDTKSIKGGGDKVNLDKLRTNALTGSMRDKEKFAHNDPRFKIEQMIPDYMKG